MLLGKHKHNKAHVARPSDMRLSSNVAKAIFLKVKEVIFLKPRQEEEQEHLLFLLECQCLNNFSSNSS